VTRVSIRPVWAVLPFLMLLQACPKSGHEEASNLVPGSRQELDLSTYIREDTSALTERNTHEIRVPVGPDSTSVTLQWATGHRDGRRIPYRISVVIPAHPESDAYRAQVAGVTMQGYRPAAIGVVSVSIEQKRSASTVARDAVVIVDLQGDGQSRMSQAGQ
jgi:hypothetical protein